MATIAVLALQGAFIEHEQMLQRLGCETFEVRQLSDWNRHKDGLIIPGGESTTMMRLLHDLGLYEPVRSSIADGLPVMGTCAGMILLSAGYLGTMDIEVVRNAYGRQLGSFVATASVEGIGDDVPMVFIRAPFISRMGDKAKALSVVDGRIVAAAQANQMACAFHPELTSDVRWHQHFIKMILNK